MPKITVVTKIADGDDNYRFEYDGTLINDRHALYVDPTYNLVILERVGFDGEEYVTTGGSSSVIFDLPVTDVNIIDNIRDMSAIELLNKLIRREET